MPTISIGLSGEEAIRRLIPEHCRDGLLSYIMDGIEPGGFLCAVLENDLVGAFGKADNINADRMEDYARFIVNYAPRDSWGSRKIVDAWIKAGGLNGMEKKQT